MRKQLLLSVAAAAALSLTLGGAFAQNKDPKYQKTAPNRQAPRVAMPGPTPKTPGLKERAPGGMTTPGFSTGSPGPRTGTPGGGMR